MLAPPRVAPTDWDPPENFFGFLLHLTSHRLQHVCGPQLSIIDEHLDLPYVQDLRPRHACGVGTNTVTVTVTGLGPSDHCAPEPYLCCLSTFLSLPWSLPALIWPCFESHTTQEHAHSHLRAALSLRQRTTTDTARAPRGLGWAESVVAVDGARWHREPFTARMGAAPLHRRSA